MNPALAIPTISTQPQALTETVGSVAIFSVVASGNPVPTYQWQKNGTNITNIANATTDSLKIPNVQSTDAGTYRVIVINSQGNDTSTGAKLTVNPPVPAVPAGVNAAALSSSSVK